MSDMTVLFKDEIKNYETYFYEDFNSINVEGEDEDPFQITTNRHYVPINPHKSYVGNFTSKSGKDGCEHGEEVYLKNYSNLLTSCYLNRNLYVIEENDDKIALKVFNYRNNREVGKRYFKTRKTIYYLTFNYKRKLFYTGEAAFKRKQKIGFKCKINITNLFNTFVYSPLAQRYTEGNSDTIFNIFLNRIIEKLGLNIELNKKPKEKYYEIILQNGKIKYPNAFLKFSEMFAPFKDVRKHGANLVTWLMKKHNLKGRKIKSLFNRYDNIDLNSLYQLYNILGQDLFNKINDEVFMTEKIYSDYNHICEGIPADLFLTKKEKENIVLLLNETKSENFINLLRDHLSFKIKLENYGENVKLLAKNRHEFNREHSEWATLIDSYSNGHITRFYGEDSLLVEDQIFTNDFTYFPILFKTTEDYQGESAHQQNCVRTYSEKAYCFIVSLRKGDKDSPERATIEYQFTRDGLRRSQTLGKYNQMLTDEWIEPVDDLDKRLDYLFKKGFINLPIMTKKYKNGRINRMFAKFKEYDETKHPFINFKDIYPRWVNEVNEKVIIDNNNYNYFEELFIDLP
jgi:hypothetical protein